MKAINYPEAVRHNQVLDYEQLRKETEDAISSYEGTQKALSEEMGKSHGYISRAKNESGPLVAAMQVEILEFLTGYNVIEERRYRVVRKPK